MKRTNVISRLILTTLFFALTIFCFSPQISYADAPQDVKLEYDSGTQTLTVTITHKSSFNFHHINNVEIKRNSGIISKNNYDSQPKDVPFTYTYKVDASEGDMLEVTATCSLSGSKTVTLKVPKATK